jgi:hypothetical protein
MSWASVLTNHMKTSRTLIGMPAFKNVAVIETRLGAAGNAYLQPSALALTVQGLIVFGGAHRRDNFF